MHDYKSVYSKCQRKHFEYFLLRYKFVEQSRSSRIGIVVSKKVAAHAVVRNRIKRVARECFRTNFSASCGLDIILTTKPGANNLTAEELATCVNQILAQLPKSSKDS